MTAHFLSFILDIISSGIIGSIVALVMDHPTRLPIPNRILHSVFMGMSAMGMGMFLTLNYALPEEGISIHILSVVFVIMLSVAFFYSRRFRNDTIQRILELLHFLGFSPQAI